MTPHQLFRETTTRARSWPPYAWAIVGGAAVAMLIAVVLMAWQAAPMLRRPEPEPTREGPAHFVPAAEIQHDLEEQCRLAAGWKATRTGPYTPDFPGAWR